MKNKILKIKEIQSNIDRLIRRQLDIDAQLSELGNKREIIEKSIIKEIDDQDRKNNFLKNGEFIYEVDGEHLVIDYDGECITLGPIGTTPINANLKPIPDRNPVTIIYGEADNWVREIATIMARAHAKVFNIDLTEFPKKYFDFNYSSIDPDTTLIIFKEVNISSLPDLLTQQAYRDEIRVNTMHKEPFMMKRPEMIICVNCNSSKEFKNTIGFNPRINIIKIDTAEDFNYHSEQIRLKQ